MTSLVRTCVLAFLGVGGLLACGHLAFDDMPVDGADASGPPTVEAGGPADGSADADGEADADAALDANGDAGASDAADGGCVGPTCAGTFVSGTIGSDANPGTAAKPLKTIKKALAIAVALGGAQKVYVAATHYPEKVVLSEGVSLLGGYECDASSCTWSRDVIANDTAILDQDDEGVVAPKPVTRKTVLDGFRIMGKGGVPTLAPGSVAITLLAGTPTITRCRIFGGDVIGGGLYARSIGVAVLGPSYEEAGAIIDRNAISGGASTDASIGVLFANKLGATVGSTAVAVVSGNTIRSGAAPFTSAILAWTSGVGTIIKNNEITAGASIAGANANAGSWGISVQSTMTIDRNRINTDVANVGGCTQSVNGNYCGGIQSLGSTSTITNNVVLGGKGPKTCAVLLADGEAALGEVILNGNTLDGGGAALTDGTLSTALAVRITFGVSASIGKVRNNILLGGVNKNRYGVYEDASLAKTARPVALDNNDFWHMGTPRNDYAYRVWNGALGVDLSFAQLGTTSATPNANLNVDPLLDASYHLALTSPVIDKGTAIDASNHDMDGDARPMGGLFDIGADEAK